MVEVTFGELAAADASIVYGDNSANRIDPIFAQDLGLISFDEVQIHFGGSMAIDNISYTELPEPGTVFLMGLGLTGLLLQSRRRR